MNKVNIELDYWKALKLRRQELGIKQSELAEKLGVSSMQVSHLENGRRIAKVSYFEKWLNELGFEISIKLKQYE